MPGNKPVPGTPYVLSTCASKIGKVIVREINPLEVLQEFLAYRRFAEEQETEREKIRAKRDIAIAAISADKDIILTYFERRFAERSQALNRFFSVLETAVETKHEALLDTALEGILGITKDNPLKDFDTFRKVRAAGDMIEI